MLLFRLNMSYKLGKKRFKTWEEMDEYTRSPEFEIEVKKAKEVKFDWVCVKCKKVISGRPHTVDIPSKKDKRKSMGFGFYCKKCFRKYFHPIVK